MVKHLLYLFIFLVTATSAFSQVDSLNPGKTKIFDLLTKELKDYKPDTTAVPNDRTTKLITELRNLRGAFNINEAIEFKLEEDRQKKEISETEFQQASAFFASGNGKRWLDNSVIWIYRKHFTEKELKGLVKFYKTSAGKKIATEFPVVMLKSMASAEFIRNIYLQKQKAKK